MVNYTDENLDTILPDSEVDQDQDQEFPDNASSSRGRGSSIQYLPTGTSSVIANLPQQQHQQQVLKQAEDQQQQQQQRQIKQELTWEDLAEYEERMAVFHKQLQESLDRYIDPYDDDSVGCLSNSNRPRLF